MVIRCEARDFNFNVGLDYQRISSKRSFTLAIFQIHLDNGPGQRDTESTQDHARMRLTGIVFLLL